jgi:RNA polymerase sigma-70 factor (ECF subfamily)
MQYESSMSAAVLLTSPGVGKVMNLSSPSANDPAINCGSDEMSEQLLISAAKLGDTVAFVELSRRHSHKILRRAYRIVKNWQDAEDVLQESLMRAFLHLKDFEERSSFSSWLTRIAINFALMGLRKKRGHVEIPMEFINDHHEVTCRWEPKDPAESPESHCSRRETEARLEVAIQQLPPRLRQVAQLNLIDGRSGEELAHTLGISVPAAKSRLSRARNALRVKLTSCVREGATRTA